MANRLLPPHEQTPERVVLINDTSIARGGATVLTLMLAELLRDRDINVTYITGDTGDNKALRALGVDVIAVGGRELLQQSRITGMVNGIHNRNVAALLADFITMRDTPGTVYHVHGWGQILSPSVFGPLRKVASRTVVHCHDFFLACPNGVFFDFQKQTNCTRKPMGLDCVSTHCDKRSYPHKLWRLARHFHFRRLFDQSLEWGRVIMIHPDMRVQFEQSDYPPDRLVTVRNPALAFSENRVTAENNKQLVFVGRIDPDKGVVELLQAAKTAGMGLTMIGDGPVRESLAASHPHIEFTGWQDRAAIRKLVQDARALVMPSRYREPFGLVAVEASLSGIPVVLPQTSLLGPEIAQHGLGWTCDISDPVGFAATLAKVRDTPKDAIRRISETGFSGTAELGQTAPDWVEATLEIYCQTLAQAA